MSFANTESVEEFRAVPAKQKRRAMVTRCSMFLAARWQRYVEGEIAAELARLDHPGVLADFQRSRRTC